MKQIVENALNRFKIFNSYQFNIKCLYIINLNRYQDIPSKYYTIKRIYNNKNGKYIFFEKNKLQYFQPKILLSSQNKSGYRKTYTLLSLRKINEKLILIFLPRNIALSSRNEFIIPTVYLLAKSSGFLLEKIRRARARERERGDNIRRLSNLLCAVSLMMTESVPKLFVTVQL